MRQETLKAVATEHHRRPHEDTEGQPLVTLDVDVERDAIGTLTVTIRGIGQLITDAQMVRRSPAYKGDDRIVLTMIRNPSPVPHPSNGT